MTLTLFAVTAVPFSAAETADTGTTLIDFESNGGWSGTNCDSGMLERISEPGNTSNHIMSLSTKNNSAYNFEIALSSTSKTAYIMQPSTSYTVKFRYKMASGSPGGFVSIRFGSGASYVPSQPKYTAKGVEAGAGTDSTAWAEFSYTFTTTANMKYNEYVSGSEYTHVMDKLYVVLWASGNSTVYIDDISIKNNDQTTTESTTITFEGSGSYSGTNCEAGMIEKIAEPGNTSNHVIRLDSKNSSGYNFEIISSDDSNTAYKLSANTKYTISFRYKVLAGSSSGNIRPHYGTKAAYDPNCPKYAISSADYSAASGSDSEWFTYSYSFTTSANMKHNEYDSSSSYTNVMDKLYLVNSSKKSTVYIDDIVITKTGKAPTPTPGPDPEVPSKFEINSFTHEPYKTAVKGDSASAWYVSRRMYSDTIDGNSLLVYQYALDVQADLIKETNNGSGNRGSSMGTNGSSASATSLVAENGTVIPVTAGKAYKITFKYKVTEVTNESYIGFSVQRGKYQSGWSAKAEVGSIGAYTFAAEYTPTDWKEVSYSFLADYTSNTDLKYLNIAVCGYGVAYMDDFVVEEIDPGKVEPLPDISNYSFSVSNGTATIINYTGKATDLVIPDRYNGLPIRAIKDFAFFNASTLKSVTIPESVKTIGDYAFQNSGALETVSIPSTCESIGKMAFAGCYMLKSITVGSENTAYVAEDGVLYNKNKTVLIAYPAQKTDEEFTIPSTVTEIANNAFENAVYLKRVSFPAGLTKVGSSAFAYCSVLTTAILPDTVTEIGSSAFRSCSMLKDFSLPKNAKLGDNVLLYCNELYKYGDINGDKTVNNNDAVALMADIASGKAEQYSYIEKLAADVNLDGIVDLLDVVIIQRHAAGWDGYAIIPSDDYINYAPETYKSTTTGAELVVNLSNNRNNTLHKTRDINYDPSKEDVIIVLIIGQSNSTTSVGYSSEYAYYQKNPGKGSPTEQVVRPDKGTVYSARGGGITELTDQYDLYNLTDPSKGSSTFSGYSPAIGKELHDATGAKIVFVQCANGATGMHEWTKDTENYQCTCSKGGKGVLYKNAFKQYMMTYQRLAEQYNIVNTGYIWNQGEHEEVYKDPNLCTVHDSATYYDAYCSMHFDLMNDCGFDFGGIVIPRSWYNRYPGATDIPQHSRRSTNARDALYKAANDIDELFVLSNYAEKIDRTMDDPSNTIHYAQNAYNGMGTEAGKMIASYLGYMSATEDTGIRVLGSDGAILAEFDKDGNLVSGSKTITKADNTKVLQILFQSLGTYYRISIDTANVEGFADEFGNINWDKLSEKGCDSFDIVINPAKIISK